MKHSFTEDSSETKTKFSFNSMLTDRVELRALILSPCVKGSKTSPTCLSLKPPVFTYIVLKNIFTV